MYLKDVDEAESGFAWAPVGRYPMICTKADVGVSAAGNPKIATTWQIAEGHEHAGVTAFEHFLTRKCKGAGFSKKKLRGLGINVDSEVEIPDEVLAQQLLGKQAFADLSTEPRMNKNPATHAYDVPAYTVGPNGQQIQAMQNRIEAFYLSNVDAQPGAVQQQLPSQPMMQAPQGYAPPAQQFAPPPGYGAPPGYAPQVAPPVAQTNAAVAPPGYGQAPVAGQQYQGAPQGAPNGGAPGYAQFPQGGAPWTQPQAPQAAQAEAGGTGKRKKA